jgi:hypothetical protein
MIAICEPICKEMSHEKVNSGFIYGLSLAFPNEIIRVYAASSHIDAIKNILNHDGKFIHDIEYKEIYIPKPESFLSIFIYAYTFFRIFSDLISSRENRLFFLSFNVIILYIIKIFKLFHSFSRMRFSLVLHSAFESIDNDQSLVQGIDLPIRKLPASPNDGLFSKIQRTKIRELPSKIIGTLKKKMPGNYFSNHLKSFFSLMKIMEWHHSEDFRYITLSPHILLNVKQLIDVDKYNIYTVVLPTNFISVRPAPSNEYVKFAIFGYGDSLVLHNIACALEQRKITKRYEIRIIGMDNRGTEGFQNITCSSKGHVLKRVDMESQAADIDAFLILYDKKKYRLSCSGSILESISMVKPVIHFDNDCVNEFNRPEMPIGIRCDSLDDYVSQLVDIIEYYDNYKGKFEEYRANIIKLRDRLSVEKTAPHLREIFWGC